MFGADTSVDGGLSTDSDYACTYVGEGDDVLIANAGNDNFYDEDGQDSLYGGSGDAYLLGTAESDDPDSLERNRRIDTLIEGETYRNRDN